MKELLVLRKSRKAKKPVFRHQDSWKRKRLPKKWRKPRGRHSKMRLKFKGNPKLPSQGFRSPAAVRGFHKSGVRPVLVGSLKHLESLASEAVIIASSIGAKKKIEMIKKAAEKKIRIVNFDPDKFMEKIKKAGESRSGKKEGGRPQKSEEPRKDGKTDPEEKRKEDTKEMEKAITKRN